MISIKHALVDVLQLNLENLSMKCDECPQSQICQEQDDTHGEPRYCWPIIKAAILGEYKFKTNHMRKK